MIVQLVIKLFACGSSKGSDKTVRKPSLVAHVTITTIQSAELYSFNIFRLPGEVSQFDNPLQILGRIKLIFN